MTATAPLRSGLRIAFVTYGLPSETSNGGPMTCWALCKHLIEAGHQLTVCALLESGDPFGTSERQSKLRNLGAELEIVAHDRLALWRTAAEDGALSPRLRLVAKARALMGSPELARYYPWAHLRPRVTELFDRVRPDVAFCYHFEALAATHGIRGTPRVAGVGDLYHLPGYFRWKAGRRADARYLLGALHQWRSHRIHTPLMFQMMAACAARGAFAAHYARWFRRRGLRDTGYFRTPIADPLGPGWREKRQAAPRPDKPRILLIGDLPTTVTASGLKLFAEQVLPALEKRLGRDRFEVHVVGGGELAPDIVERLRRPSVVFRGRIDPPDDEFLSADVLLVPTPITLGIRVRIISGFAYGCCVVAHSANRAGIPEIDDRRNALVGSSAHELADAVVAALADRALRDRLSAAARQTYESCFAIDVAAGVVRETMEAVARSPSTRSSRRAAESSRSA